MQQSSTKDTAIVQAKPQAAECPEFDRGSITLPPTRAPKVNECHASSSISLFNKYVMLPSTLVLNPGKKKTEHVSHHVVQQRRLL